MRSAAPAVVLAILGMACTVAAGDAAVNAWRVEATPVVGTADVSVLSSVACASGRDCMAVGSSSNTLSSPSRTLAERWDGRRWRRQEIATPLGTSPTLYGVSCPSVRACVAVGSGFRLSDRRQPVLVEAWNGKGWRVQPTPSLRARDVALHGVSCTSATACVAVGFIEPSTALVEHWDGARWRIDTLPQAARSDQLQGVSCASARACVAVGLNTTGNARPVALAWNGTTWRGQHVPVPHRASGGMFEAVSCTSVRACTAAGAAFGRRPLLAERWNGRSWRVQSTQNPPHWTASLAEPAFDGVSCASLRTCIAVGTLNPGNRTEYVIESWNGRRWQLDPVPHPTHFEHGALLGVSCVTRHCAAVGGYTTGRRTQVTLAIGG